MNKNFQKLKDFQNGHTNSFKIVVLADTWLKDENANKNSLYQVPNYTAIHIIRKSLRKGRGMFIILLITRIDTILARAISLKLFPLKSSMKTKKFILSLVFDAKLLENEYEI